MRTTAAFVSYSRKDSEFVQRLVRDLKTSGASVWLDKFDIKPGKEWDRAVEDALIACPRMLLILTPTSAASTNVLDEISVAIRMNKEIIPILYQDCAIPMRVCRLQYIDFRADYNEGLRELLGHLNTEQGSEKDAGSVTEGVKHGQEEAPGSEFATPATSPIAPTSSQPSGRVWALVLRVVTILKELLHFELVQQAPENRTGSTSENLKPEAVKTPGLEEAAFPSSPVVPERMSSRKKVWALMFGVTAIVIVLAFASFRSLWPKQARNAPSPVTRGPETQGPATPAGTASSNQLAKSETESTPVQKGAFHAGSTQPPIISASSALKVPSKTSVDLRLRGLLGKTEQDTLDYLGTPDIKEEKGGFTYKWTYKGRSLRLYFLPQTQTVDHICFDRPESHDGFTGTSSDVVKGIAPGMTRGSIEAIAGEPTSRNPAFGPVGYDDYDNLIPEIDVEVVYFQKGDTLFSDIATDIAENICINRHYSRNK